MNDIEPFRCSHAVIAFDYRLDLNLCSSCNGSIWVHAPCTERFHQLWSPIERNCGNFSTAFSSPKVIRFFYDFITNYILGSNKISRRNCGPEKEFKNWREKFLENDFHVKFRRVSIRSKFYTLIKNDLWQSEKLIFCASELKTGVSSLQSLGSVAKCYI